MEAGTVTWEISKFLRDDFRSNRPEKLQIFQHQEPKERTLASTNVPDHEIEA